MKSTLRIIIAVTFGFYATSGLALGQKDPTPSGGTINLFTTMTHMLNGQSSTELEAEFRYREMGWGITYLGLIVDKEERKNAGRVFGMEANGKIYVNPRKPRLKRLNNFFEAQRIGPFLHYKVVEGGPAGPSAVQIRYPAEKLLNVETGKIRTLTRKRFRKLAKDDTELLKRFENEPQKSRILTRYLKEYFERNPY